MEAAPMEFEGLAITDALVHTGLLIIDRTPYRIYSYIYCTRPIYRDDFETPVACCPGKYVVRAHLFFSRFCGSLVKLGLLIGIFKTSVSVYKPTPPS